jgi:hypothetical protein
LPGWRNLVDARDLKSLGLSSPCRFESGPGYLFSFNLELRIFRKFRRKGL